MGNFLSGDCVRLTPSCGTRAADRFSSTSLVAHAQIPNQGEMFDAV